MDHSPIKISLIALLVIAFGWGSGYGIFEGAKYLRKSFNADAIGNLKRNSLKAASLESKNSNFYDNKLTILVGGDIMMDRAIRAIGERNGYESLFDRSLTSLFKKADIVMANLEGPITTNTSKTLVNGKTTDSFTFTFSPKSAEALMNAGITIVSLANNHTDNFGFEGYQQTQNYLQIFGLKWFGNPWNGTSTHLTSRDTTGDLPDSPIVTILEENNIKIAFVGYHAFQMGIDKVIAEIKRVSSPDVFTIVMPHWGEEYVAVPSEKMRSYARAFITAGADAVIGAHPHVVAEQEWAGAVPIYYSLGNLLFDQYFSEETKHGLIVELNIVKNEESILIDHITNHDVYSKPGLGASLIK